MNHHVRVRALTVFAAFCFASLSIQPAASKEGSAIPDFSGLWGRNGLNFELPLSGPGPVRNLMRRADGTMDGSRMVGDYANPILKPEAAEILKRKGEISLSGHLFPDPLNQCRPMPPPYVLAGQLGLQVLQERDQITLIYFDDHKVRRVRMNATHPAHVIPTWQGDAIGRYEGDTLVIDTVGMKVGPLAVVDRYGTPFSETLHVVERYRLIDGEAAKEAVARGEKESARIGVANAEGVTIDPDYKGSGLQVQITVEDPGVFTMPWSALVTYRRALGEFPEFVCAESTFEYFSLALPTADRPDF